MKKTTKILFWLTLVLLPSYFFRIAVTPNITIPLLDLLSLAFVLSALSLMAKQNDLVMQHIKRNFPFPLIIVLLVILSFSTSYIINIHAFDWTDGAGIIKSYIILPVLFGFCFSFFYGKKHLSFSDIALPLFFSTSALSLLGYFFGLESILTFDGRLSIFFESPNQLAMLLALGLLCGAYLLKNEIVVNSDKKRPLWLFFLLTSMAFHLFGLFLTCSFGAFLGLLAAMPVVFLKKNLFASSYPKMVSLLVVLLSLSVLGLGTILSLLSYHQSIPATSLDSRIAIYTSAQKIVANNFLWGVGPGNFQSAYLQNQKHFSPYPQWAVPHAHNNLIHYWAEGGIIATMGFLMLIALLIKKRATLRPFALACLLYFLVHGIVDTTVWRNDVSILFWLFLFAALSKTNNQANDKLKLRF